MRKLIITFVAIILSMCNSNKEISQSTNMLAPLIVYKTKNEYPNNIPIMMNESRDKILSYPAVQDIYLNGAYAKPDNLANGFLLDNFGLSVNSVFTSFTFEEYSKLSKNPTLQEFMDRIIDKNPISEMYHCGKRNEFKTIEEINKLIKNGLENCKKVK